MLIGIAGYGQAGKDSVGDVLTREHGFRTTAFAELMRSCARALNPIVGYTLSREVRYVDALDALGYDRAKRECPEVRAFLQRLGTEMGRDVFAEDFWVDMTFAHMDLTKSWAITDVRFKNEARAVKGHGGFVVRVERPDVGPANDHVSEHDLDDWPFDYVLHNDGMLGALSHKASQMLLLVENQIVRWDVV